MRYLFLFFIFSFVNTYHLKAQYPFNYLKPNKEKGWNIFSINQVIQSFLFHYDNETVLCLSDKIQQRYTKKETTEWTNQMRADIVTLLLAECNNTPNPQPQSKKYSEYREKAYSFQEQKKYKEAIDLTLLLEADSVANVNDYNRLGWCYLLTKQYSKAIKYLKKGEKLDEADLYIQGNLAHAYLLSNEEEKAMSIYQKYKGQNINETTSWEEMVKKDFATFTKAGILHIKYEEIIKMVSEDTTK